MPTAPGPTSVSCTYINGDDCWVTGDFVVSAAPATGNPAVAGYRICRSNDATPGAFAGCDVDMVSPVGSGGASFNVSGGNLPGDAMRRAYYFAAKDTAGGWGPWNTPRYVRVDRNNPQVSATGASPDWVSGATANLSATDWVGGTAANSGIAEIRYRWNTPLDAACTTGTVTGLVPPLTAPQGDNVLYLCVRDRAGRVGSWSGQYRVDYAAPTAPGPTTVACAFTNGDDCWVSGDFTANVTPATDSAGIAGYRICRSNDAAPGAFAGCDVDMVLPVGSGGTSFSVSGGNLPGDAMRRAYYFAAKDNAGVWGPWNTPRYVRLDRHNPSVSASGASPEWVAHIAANVLANDFGGGLYGSSGIADIRYRWNSPLDAGCTAGTVLGATPSLTAPPGDNVLYLCVRDRVGRVGSWSGQYRVDFTAPTAPGPTTVACGWTHGDDCWVSGDFTATVTPATDPSGIAGYRICRSNDSSGGVAACEVDLLPAGTGGTSINVGGSHLAGDGFRRGYFFAAKDVAGVLGPWNSPRYVRVDRHPPRVSASGASTTWVSASTATLSADDAEGGSAANSGLVEARWAWNTPLDATCTSGTVYGSGATLVAPSGNNVLYLCGRDRLGRVGSWSGPYRIGVDPNQPPQLFVLGDSVNGAPLPHNGTIGWGSMPLNGGSKGETKSLWVKNGAAAGGGNLVLEHSPANLELVPLQGNAFTQAGTLISPLGPQASDSFEVKLSTTQSGSFESLLKIWHNDPLRPNPLILHLTATVGGEPPVIGSMIPSILEKGQITTVRLTGSHLQGATFAIPPDPDHPEQVVPLASATTINRDGTELTATLDARAAGVEGVYLAAVSTNCENCAAATNFRVAPAATPVIDMYTPAEVAPGRIFPVVLTGANLRGAILTTSHPEVQVLDVDNSDDEILTGILLVPIGINPHGFEIHAQTPENPVVGVPVDFVVGEGSKRNIPVVAEDKLARARAAGVDLPGVYFQEPTLSAAMLERLRTGAVPPDQAIACIFSFVQRLFTSTRVYVVPLDAFGSVDPRVLEAIGLGELVKFGALTVTFFADVRIQFTFDYCTFRAFAGCLNGIFATEVVGLGGVATSFSYCIPFGGVTSSVSTTGGSLDSFELSSAGNCTTVTQLTPPTEGGIESASGSRGAHYATVQPTACCDETIHAQVRLSTFTEFPFFALNNVVASGPVLEVSPNPEGCQEPEPELMVFLDANHDNNFATGSSAVALAALSDIDRYVSCTNPDNHQPIDVGRTQTMALVAAYVRRSGDLLTIVAPPSGVTSVTFSIDDNKTSHFEGSAMNYPPSGVEAPYEPDYALGGGGQQVAFDANHVATTDLICRDYGGFTEVKATPNLPSKPARVLTIPTPQEGQHELPLPKAGWMVAGSNQLVATAQLDAMADDDDSPSATAAGGSGNLTGDGLKAFGEYRGFVVGNHLRRLDPSRKDVFVRNQLPQSNSFSFVDQLDLELHFVEESEIFDDGQFRLIDFRGGSLASGQSAIRLVEGIGVIPAEGESTRAGFTTGSLGRANEVPTSTIFANVIEWQTSTPPPPNSLFTNDFFYNWTASHEFGHAVDLCHRQENAQGQAIDEFTLLPISVCPDGAPLLPRAQMPQKVTVMHSGEAIRLFALYTGNHAAFSGFHEQSKTEIRIKPFP